MSVYVSGTRIGADGSINVFNDTRLQALVDSLDAVLINSEPEELLADIVDSLEATYGSGNVNQMPTSVKYDWVWDAETGVWVEKQTTSTTVTVDDGEATDVRLRIDIGEILT